MTMNGTKPLKKNLERGRNEGSYQASLTKHRSATIRMAFAIAFIVVISSMMATFESDEADGDPGGECGGGLNWQYDSTHSTLKITKTDSTDFTGVMNDYTDDNPSPWIGFKNNIIKTEITGYITRIGNYAFYNLTSLNNIKITDLDAEKTVPDLASIGNHAFDKCENLVTIKFDDDVKNIGDFSKLTSIGDYAFNKCKFTGNLTIPNKVTTIGNYAFNKCEFTGNLTIPNSVTSIGSHAFNECGFNGTLTLGSSITRIGGYSFCGCKFIGFLTIPNKVPIVGDHAFDGCRFDGTLTLGSSITKIGVYAFYGCKFTGDLTIPNKVETIGEYAFNGCFTQEEPTDRKLILSAELISIGNHAFDGCKFTGSLTIPNKVETIGNYAFSGCKFTGNLTIPNKVTTIGNYAFNGCFTQEESTDWKLALSTELISIGNHAFDGCKFTGNLTIPNKVTTVGNYAFNGCDFNGILTLGDNIMWIEGYAFNGCKFIGSLAILDSVTTIGEYAFNGCNFDGTLTLGNDITRIGGYAFNGCKFTGNLTIPNKVTTVGDHAFNECNFDGNLILGGSITEIGKYAFNGCKFAGNLTITNKITIIEDYVFNGCKFAGNLTIPNKVTTVGDHAFDGCKFTGNLTIPDSVTTIGEYAFSGCEFNGALTLTNNISNIGQCAFYGCKFTGDLKIPDGIKTLDSYAYKGCKFNKLIIPSSISNSGDYPFYECEFSGGLEIDKNTKVIYDKEFGYAAFSGRLMIPDKVQSIGRSAFEGSTFSGVSSNRHIIPDSVETIGKSAFKSCSLKNGNNGTGDLQLSRNLVTIEEDAFHGADLNVEELIFSPRLKTQGANAFAKDETGLQPVIKKLAVMNLGDTSIVFDGYEIHNADDEKIEGFNKENKQFIEHIFKKNGASNDDSIILKSDGEITENLISYFTDGGSKPEPIGGYYYKGQDITIAKYEGTKEGYSFFGWLYNDTPIQPGITIKMGDDPIEFKALWIKKLKVIYDVNGGSAKGPETKEYARMTTVTVEGYSGIVFGCQFEGWTWDGKTYAPGESVTISDSDIVLIAKWVPVHKVTYDIDGGSGTAPAETDVVEGASFEVKSYSGTKTGYLFDGWICDGKVYQAGDTVKMDKKDVTFLAIWTATHSVTYDLNGGTGTAPTQEDVAEGDTFTVKACTATMEGYTFNGWSYDRLNFFEGDIITMELDDIVLKAVWKKGQPMHHVTYDLRGGSGEAPIQADVQEGDTFTVKMYTGTKEGYTFAGWEYGIRIYEMGATIKMGSHDIVLKALWLSDTPGEQDEMSKIIMIAATVIGSISAVGIGAILFIRKS